MGWDRAALLASDSAPLRSDQAKRFLALVAEREARRPLQHLTGTQAFWGRDFLVTPDVLIPRPETEILVETALGLLAGVVSPLVVDVGSGSGCIALTIAAEKPDAEVHGVDISHAALEIARTNARRLGLESRVRLSQGDLLSPVEYLAGSVDLVVSNPPYVSAEQFPSLMPEVRDHDPRLALVPTPNAPDVYRRLAAGARRLLRAGGWLAVEIGLGMANDVRAVTEGEGFRVERAVLDLQGIPRVLVAR
jgi:release factor glutamine methyltransferase